jgi:predicted metalloprotease
VRRAQERAGDRTEANRYSVALELQADCYAGVWAAHADDVSGGRVAREAEDLQEGLRAASAIGGGTLQRETRTCCARQLHARLIRATTRLLRGYQSGDRSLQHVQRRAVDLAIAAASTTT